MSSINITYVPCRFTNNLYALNNDRKVYNKTFHDLFLLHKINVISTRRASILSHQLYNKKFHIYTALAERELLSMSASTILVKSLKNDEMRHFHNRNLARVCASGMFPDFRSRPEP